MAKFHAARFLALPFLLGAGGSGVDPTRSLPVIPEAIASFGAATTASHLWVYGGHVGKTHQHSRQNLTGAFRRLDLGKADAWEELPGGPPLQSVALVAVDGALYRIGGMSAQNDAGAKESLHSVSDVARFDAQAKVWKEVRPLPEARSSHDACVIGSTVYVAGGWTLDGEKKGWLTTAWSLDLAAADSVWRPLAKPPFARRALALAECAGKVWAVGGMTEDGKQSPEVDVFDPAANVWTKGPKLPGSGFGCSATTVGGRLYVSGRDGVVQRLAADGSAWERAGELCTPRMFHRLVPEGRGRILAVAGAAQEGHLATVESIDPQMKPGAPRVAEWRIPFPGGAKNRQGVFLQGNQLVAFGGNRSLEQHDFGKDDFLAESWALDLTTLQWSARAPFPVARQSMRTVVSTAGGAAGTAAVGLAVGGFGHDGKVARSQDAALAYDFGTDRWKELAWKLPQTRTQFGLAEHDGALWIFGGTDYDPRREGAEFQFPLEVLRLDSGALERGFATTAHRLPRARRAFGGAFLGGRYYLIGGLREEFQKVEECDVFDPAAGSWSTLPAPPVHRISPEVVALDGRLYLAGGSSLNATGDVKAERSLLAFDPSAKKWSVVLDELPFEPRHLRMFAWRGRLVLYTAHEADAHMARIVFVRMGNGDAAESAGAESANR